MFIEQKANENSYLKRRKKYGVGINDADYFTSIDGQTCPAYKRWNDMMYKTFSKTVEVNTKICKEWLIFSKFRHVFGGAIPFIGDFTGRFGRARSFGPSDDNGHRICYTTVLDKPIIGYLLQ